VTAILFLLNIQSCVNKLLYRSLLPESLLTGSSVGLVTDVNGLDAIGVYTVFSGKYALQTVHLDEFRKFNAPHEGHFL
jgi:hypothetical protein